MKHLHTYKRVTGKKHLFRCNDPDCTHFVDKRFLDGKRARCPFCGIDYILTWRELQLAVPHCPNCLKGKERKKHLSDETVMAKLAKLFE